MSLQRACFAQAGGEKIDRQQSLCSDLEFLVGPQPHKSRNRTKRKTIGSPPFGLADSLE